MHELLNKIDAGAARSAVLNQVKGACCQDILRKLFILCDKRLRAPLRLTLLDYYVIIKIEKEKIMKQIIVGLIVLIFLVGLAIGVTGAVVDLFANNFEMTSGAAAMLLTLLLLAVVLPTLLDFLESWLS